MIRVISFGGKYAVFDSESLALIPVGPLAVPMVPYLCEPLPADCPVSIRYALAQYPSPEISATYAALRDAWEKGLLFAPPRQEQPPVNRVTLTEVSDRALKAAAALAPAQVILTDPSAPEEAVGRVREAVAGASVTVCLDGKLPSPALLSEAEVLVTVKGVSDPLLSALAGTSAVPVLNVPAGELVSAVEALSAMGFPKISSLPASPEEAKTLAARLRRKKEAAPVFLPFALAREGNVFLPVREAAIDGDGTVIPSVPPTAAQTPFDLLSPSSSPWQLACAGQAVNLTLHG